MQSLETLRQIARETLGVAPERLAVGATLDDVGMDSLAAIDLVFAVENRFGIEIDACDLERTSSLEDLAAIVDKKLEREPRCGD